MKQIAILMIALITTLGISAQDKKKSNTTSTTTTVYIAKDKGAKAYHKTKKCKYLTNCKKVESITLKEAKKLERTACTSCYPDSQSSSTKKSNNKDNQNSNKNNQDNNKNGKK